MNPSKPTWKNAAATQPREANVIQYINAKLTVLGQPINNTTVDAAFIELARPLLNNLREKDRLLSHDLCPVDRRIQNFLDRTLDGDAPHLPAKTLVLDRPGLGRMLSLPPEGNLFTSPLVTSYRLKQGILHNPKSDRRTTKGVFHVVEGGLPIPNDKVAVTKETFKRILNIALTPPEDLMTLPFTALQDDKARPFVSLLIRPRVCPGVDKVTPEMSMEIRFFVPGSVVCNLDFVEGIFGNGGDPALPENDAALDIHHWTGHTGCIILAPHLVEKTKRELGLPHYDQATERQRRDGQCWQNENERYNDGNGFKVTCRDASGVVVTVIADNYFGYCKKEVKTQISFAANLFGLAEEEHAGGAIAYSSAIMEQDFCGAKTSIIKPAQFAEAIALLGSSVEVKAEGYAVDKQYPDILYVPHEAVFSVKKASISWNHAGSEVSIPLLAAHTYILPSGYKVRLEKQSGGTTWRLVGVMAEGTLCHKPSTVSGGGKSEISKSINYAMIQGPVFVKDFQQNLNDVANILDKDFSNIYKTPAANSKVVASRQRKILSADRSLGSVVKLLTHSTDYTDEHNAWIAAMPQTLRQLVFIVKRYYRAEWGDQWRQHFNVDHINGYPGHELRFESRKLVANYLRIGFDPDGSWRTHAVRPDYNPADKVQVEDDITASVVVPTDRLEYTNPDYRNPSVKIVSNCETLLFQRPDDAIHRGFDKQAESDLAAPNTLICNFEPLDKTQVAAIVENIVEFDQYSDPMKQLLLDFLQDPDNAYVVSSAHSRIVDGKPTKNPRYLQRRPDQVNARETYIAGVGSRLARRAPIDKPLYFPVSAVLAGRRNGPADRKLNVPPSAIYNPIHYQELPELFMDFVCSLTGKSPSTTGFGSEGALTKGPFNAVLPVIDVNNALVSFILTGYAGFTTCAGYVGPKYRVDHDISLLIPEIWCRLKPEEYDAKLLIENGFLEKLDDFEFDGKKVLASRLGYRITSLFTERYFGRVFETPSMVCTTDMLKPELQGMDQYSEGIDAIIEAQKLVADHYFADGSVELACPPLKALLHIMANGNYEGRDVQHPEIRAMFDRETMLASDWYQARLQAKQQLDQALWQQHIVALESAILQFEDSEVIAELDLEGRLNAAKQRRAFCDTPEYIQSLVGTLGVDPNATTALK